MDAHPSLRSACAAGRPVPADPRAAAHARRASVWLSYTVFAEANATLRWTRADQFRAQGAPALGRRGWTERSAAAEYPVLMANGDLGLLTDEVTGVGFLRLRYEDAAPAAPGSEAPAAPAAPATPAAPAAPGSGAPAAPVGVSVDWASCVNGG